MKIFWKNLYKFQSIPVNYEFSRIFWNKIYDHVPDVCCLLSFYFFLTFFIWSKRHFKKKFVEKY